MLLWTVKKNGRPIFSWMWWTISTLVLAMTTVRSFRISAAIRRHNRRIPLSGNVPTAAAALSFNQQRWIWIRSTSRIEQWQNPRLIKVKPSVSSTQSDRICWLSSTALHVSHDVEYGDDYPAIDFVPEDEYPPQYINQEDIAQDIVFLDEPPEMQNQYHNRDWENPFLDEPPEMQNPYHNRDWENPILKDLNDAQTEAVTLPPQSLVRVMAGPGSGKTRVLTSRVAHLIQENPRDRILALTFTKKAAGEMGERLEKSLHGLHKEMAQLSQQPLMEMPGSSQTANSHSVSGDPNDDAYYRDPRGEDAAMLDAELESYMMAEAAVESADLQDAQIASTVNNQLRRVTLGTFHSVCAKILRWNAEYLSSLPTVQMYTEPGELPTVDRNFAIADQSEQLRVLREILKDHEIDEKKEGIRLWSILSTISDCKESFAQGKNPFESRKKPLSRTRQIVARIFEPYRKRLMASNHLDFDDLIYLTRELLSEHQDVRERLQQRWNHVLVDEFQDTSLTQLQIVKSLTTDSLFVVGDADQSIYSWRGAHVGLMADIQDHFPSIDTIYLMENYRSTSNIVKAAQKIISSGSEDSKEAKLRKEMLPKRGKGSPPRIWFCEDLWDSNKGEKGMTISSESMRVVAAIKEGVENGKYGPDHEVAIIYRTNAQSRDLEQELTSQKLKYVMFGSATSFYQRAEVKDCLSFIRLLANGRDRGSLLRAFSITRGIGTAAVNQFDIYCDQVSEYYRANLPGQTLPTELEILLSICDKSRLDANAPRADEVLPQRQIKALLPFSQSMCAVYDLALRQNLENVLSFLVTKMSIKEHVSSISKGPREAEDRMGNVYELVSASRKYSSMGPCLGQSVRPDSQDFEFGVEASPVEQFVEDIALVTDMASSRDEDKKQLKVSMMTIHASKGMEFDTVFLVGNEEKTFPTAQAIQEELQSPELLQEERRLCYVAMTRAKSELIMTYRQTVGTYVNGKYQYVERPRSRFLDILIGESPKTTGSRGPKKAISRTSNVGTRGAYSHSPLKASTPSRDRKIPRRHVSSSSRSSYDQNRLGTTARLDQIPTIKPRPPGGIRGGARASNASKRTVVREKSTLAAPSKQKPTKPGSQKKLRSAAVASRGATRQQSTLASLPTSSSTAPARKHSAKQANTPPSAKKIKDDPKKQKSLDSTWLFPVGSEVSHQRHGRGIVLPPPPPSESTDLPVRVKFSSGEQEIFCARGTEISPAIR